MAFQNALSDEVVYIVRKGAVQYATKYYHTFIGTGHIFESLINFLVKNGGTEKYKDTYQKLYGILNKYNNMATSKYNTVTDKDGTHKKKIGPSFEAAFLEICPRGETPDASTQYVITPNDEWRSLNNALLAEAARQKRTVEVEDLIMALLADKAYLVYNVLSKVFNGESLVDQMYKEIADTFVRYVVPKIDELENIKELENLNDYVSKHPQTTIDYDDTLRKIEMGLVGRTCKNVVLTGPAGCGKTQYVMELAQRLNKNDVPNELKGKVIYSLTISGLMMDTKFRGEMETKIYNIFGALQKHPEAILFIDELHSIIGAGDGVDGSASAGQIIKPYISRGDVQMIGCTTATEYTKYILPDKAFARRFSEVKISEPDGEHTKQILKGLIPVENAFFNKESDSKVIDRVVNLSERYALEQANPAKSIAILEDAYKYSKIYDPADKKVIDDSDIVNAIRTRYGIYISDTRLKDTADELHKILLGQDRAIDEVIDSLKIVDAGIVDKTRPMMSLLLAGSTGVGKTETAKIIAKTFFGSDKNLVKLNMGDYSEEYDVAKLTGAAPGLVGYDDEPELIKGAREHPSCVVLFDEIEKAHPDIQKALLNILDEGEMTDNKGNKVSFRNTIIIFTTNLGYDSSIGQEQGIGFMRTINKPSQDKTMAAIRNYFRPEFLGRLDKVIFYDSLPESIIRQLITRYFKEYKEQCPDIAIDRFTENDIKEIIKNSNIVANGARGVRKQVRHQIVVAEDRKQGASK